MRRSLYLLILVVVAGAAVLAYYAPDLLSLLFVLLMAFIIGAAILGGIVPVLSYESGLERAENNIERAVEVQSSSAWTAIQSKEDFFGQRMLDEVFDEYRIKVTGQQKTDRFCAISRIISMKRRLHSTAGRRLSARFWACLPVSEFLAHLSAC